MHLSGPNASMTCRYQRAWAATNSSEVGGRCAVCHPNPLSGMASPPILATTLGQAAIASMSAHHPGKISSWRPAHAPTPSGVPKWSSTICVPSAARASSRNSRFWWW